MKLYNSLSSIHCGSVYVYLLSDVFQCSIILLLTGENMDTLAILALLKAKPGKEKDVEEFLKAALQMVQAETGTTTWYALKMGQDKFGIFDTFPDETARNAHLSGEIAKTLFAKAEELLAEPPTIEQPEVLAVKTPYGMQP